MIFRRHVLRDISRAVTAAGDRTLDDLRQHSASQEPHVTDRLAANIQNELDGRTLRGIRWKAKTLTDHGRNAEENRFGADLLGVLTIDLVDYHVCKGFLAQAKLFQGPRLEQSPSQMDVLAKQCSKMLQFTPDSFVFLYSPRAIKIVPASAVRAVSRLSFSELCSRSLGTFFKEYVESFIGDTRLRSPSLEDLRGAMREYECRVRLHIVGSDEDQAQHPPAARNAPQAQFWHGSLEPRVPLIPGRSTGPDGLRSAPPRASRRSSMRIVGNRGEGTWDE